MSVSKTVKHALFGLGFHACAFSLIYMVTRTGEPGYLTTTGRWMLWVEGFPTTWILDAVERDIVKALPLFKIFMVTSAQWLAVGAFLGHALPAHIIPVVHKPRWGLDAFLNSTHAVLLIGAFGGGFVHTLLYWSITIAVCPPGITIGDNKCSVFLLIEAFLPELDSGGLRPPGWKCVRWSPAQKNGARLNPGNSRVR